MLVQTTPRHRQRRRHDAVLWAILAASTVLSVVAFVVTYQKGQVLAYNDAISHMQIARRVVSGSNTGLAQLGSVWLPLPHFLILPLVWIDGLYYSGIAGALLSMGAFVVCCVLLYKILLQLTSRKAAGITGAAVFAFNVNVLYMQSTPMTELLLFATLLAVVYCLQVWADSGRYTYLVGAGVAALAATMTRYESWPILAVLSGVVIVAAWRQRKDLPRRQRWGRMQDVAIVFTMAAYAGIVFWLIWGWALFGDPLSFQNGDYAKPSLWLTNNEPAIGDLALSAKVFWYALTENVPGLLVIVAGIGLVAFVYNEMVRGKLAGRSLIIPSLLILVPFFVMAIYTGQRPLHVQQVNDDLYNTRFGLIMVLPVALFAGYLIGVFRPVVARYVAAAATITSVVAICALLLQRGEIITLKDPQVALTADRAVHQSKAEQFLKPHYDGGAVLMETFGNERLAFKAVPSQSYVYEGTNRHDRWKRSLVDPVKMKIRWIVMRCTPGYRDKVCDALQGKAALNSFQLVYTGPGQYYIYKRG